MPIRTPCLIEISRNGGDGEVSFPAREIPIMNG